MSWASLTSGSAERDREHPVAQVQARGAAARRGRRRRCRAAPARPPPRPRRPPRGPRRRRCPAGTVDDHVGEVAPGRLAQPQAAQLDVGAERVDRLARRPPARRPARGPSARWRSRRSAARRRRRSGRRPPARRSRRPGATPASTASSPSSTANEPAMSPAKWKALERSAGAAVAARGAQRDDRAAQVDAERDADDRELYQWIVGGRRRRDQVPDRLDDDDGAAREQDRRLAERAEVLRAAVPVGVPGVGRAPAEPHREERQHGGDHVAARLDPGRDQPEAVGQQARRRASARRAAPAAAIEASAVRCWPATLLGSRAMPPDPLMPPAGGALRRTVGPAAHRRAAHGEPNVAVSVLSASAVIEWAAVPPSDHEPKLYELPPRVCGEGAAMEFSEPSITVVVNGAASGRRAERERQAREASRPASAPRSAGRGAPTGRPGSPPESVAVRRSSR